MGLYMIRYSWVERTLEEIFRENKFQKYSCNNNQTFCVYTFEWPFAVILNFKSFIVFKIQKNTILTIFLIT